MQVILLNYNIILMLAENPKEMVKQVNLKQNKFNYNSGSENISFWIYRN